MGQHMWETRSKVLKLQVSNMQMKYQSLVNHFLGLSFFLNLLFIYHHIKSEISHGVLSDQREQDWKNQSQKAAQVRKVKKKKSRQKKEKKTELNKTEKTRHDRK